MRTHRITTAVTALAAILSASVPARAATYTWTGGNGSSNSWYSAGNWAGGAAPADEPPGDYVFTASGWNAAQTTIAIDGANRNPDVNTLTFNGNASVPLTIQIRPGNTLYLTPAISGATTIDVAATGVTHTIAGSSGATIQLGDDQQWQVDGALDVSAVIWDDGESPSPGFTKTGAGTLILDGSNSFSGPITIDQGTISVSTIANQGQACNLGKGGLTLGGGVLSYTGTGSNVSTTRGFALGAGGGAIDVQNAATSLTFTGAVTGGQAALTKTGSGALTLAGRDTYTGLTTVAAGALTLVGTSVAAPLAWGPVFNGGGADITGGQLVFNYAGGSDPESTIGGLLVSGKIYTSAAGEMVSLTDNTVNDTVALALVAALLPGDANGDGNVDGSDLNIVLSNYGTMSGGTWAMGDFNYDGKVDGTDLNIVLTNYGTSSHDTAAVPEPCMLLLAAAGFMGLLAYAWRERK